MKKRILLGLVTLLILGLIIVIWQLDIPTWKKLDISRLTDLKQTTIIYDIHNQPVTTLNGGVNRTLVSIDEIPEHVQQAFIAIEDSRFYEHCGIDLRRICGAILSNIKAGSYAEGASTITQQLIKLTHLTSEKKISRKLQEIWLALQLERLLNKDDILGSYLNTVYFGNGAYGIEAAAQAYFSKSCSELSLSEGALLAGIIKAPSSYAPHISMEKALERRKQVLSAMKREKMISEKEFDAAIDEPVMLSEKSMTESTCGWYADAALVEASELLNISIDELLTRGYKIYTSLQKDMQVAAEGLYQQAEFFPDESSDGTKPQSALIALNPEDGEIYCVIGGREYSTRMSFNRALQMKRQPGSAFKPISVYAAAVDYLGYSPYHMIEDVSRDFGNGYAPSNASGIEYGSVTLRQALSKSMNLATVDLITRTGIDAAKRYAERAGIKLDPSDSNLSLALGSLTNGVSPAEMCAAYASLVNGGYHVKPHTIIRIDNSRGEVVYTYSKRDQYVMSEASGRMIISMLEEAVKTGTAKRLSGVGFPVAAKTGTVNFPDGGNRDAWLIACTPTVVLAVWQGYDWTDREHKLPEGATGGAYTAQLAAAFLKSTSSVSNGGSFPIPHDMSRVLLDAKALSAYKTPMLASETTPASHLVEEILPQHLIPSLTSDLWEKPKQVEAVYTATDADGHPQISFMALDSYSEYRIIRRNGNEQEEIGVIQAKKGEYASFSDSTSDITGDIEYCVIARHMGFAEEGEIVESEPSEWVKYIHPSFLERIIDRKTNNNPEYDPLFEAVGQ